MTDTASTTTLRPVRRSAGPTEVPRLDGPANERSAPARPAAGRGIEQARDDAIRTVRDFVAAPGSMPLDELADALETLKRCDAVSRWRTATPVPAAATGRMGR